MRRRNGWVFIDILMALLLVSVMAAILGSAAAWHHRALAHLADSRAASRLAESALISMQAGQHPDATKFTCRQIPGPTNDSTSPGMTWVEVTAAVNSRSASLIGLVPKNSLPPGGGS